MECLIFRKGVSGGRHKHKVLRSYFYGVSVSDLLCLSSGDGNDCNYII